MEQKFYLVVEKEWSKNTGTWEDFTHLLFINKKDAVDFCRRRYKATLKEIKAEYWDLKANEPFCERSAYEKQDARNGFWGFYDGDGYEYQVRLYQPTIIQPIIQ